MGTHKTEKVLFLDVSILVAAWEQSTRHWNSIKSVVQVHTEPPKLCKRNLWASSSTCANAHAIDTSKEQITIRRTSRTFRNSRRCRMAPRSPSVPLRSSATCCTSSPQSMQHSVPEAGSSKEAASKEE